MLAPDYKYRSLDLSTVVKLRSALRLLRVRFTYHNRTSIGLVQKISAT
jgi:hypothetical protein